jgi:hypothetical protein
MRPGRSAIRLLALGLVAAAASGCVSSERSALYDRDEPEQRLASMVDGVVARVDERSQVVVLDNGQMYRVSGDRAILVNGQPVRLARVQPGTRVTIVSGSPVVYQNGQYVAVAPGTATVTTPGTVVAAPGTVVTPAPGTVVAPAPGTVVAAPPAGTVVAAPPAAVAVPSNVVRMHGRVVDVESNGDVKVRLPDGNSFELRPPAGTVYRKGDPVTIDMTFGAPAPSALPR